METSMSASKRKSMPPSVAGVRFDDGMTASAKLRHSQTINIADIAEASRIRSSSGGGGGGRSGVVGGSYNTDQTAIINAATASANNNELLSYYYNMSRAQPKSDYGISYLGEQQQHPGQSNDYDDIYELSTNSESDIYEHDYVEFYRRRALAFQQQQQQQQQHRHHYNQPINADIYQRLAEYGDVAFKQPKQHKSHKHHYGGHHQHHRRHHHGHRHRHNSHNRRDDRDSVRHGQYALSGGAADQDYYYHQQHHQQQQLQAPLLPNDFSQRQLYNRRQQLRDAGLRIMPDLVANSEYEQTQQIEAAVAAAAATVNDSTNHSNQQPAQLYSNMQSLKLNFNVTDGEKKPLSPSMSRSHIRFNLDQPHASVRRVYDSGATADNAEETAAAGGDETLVQK
jgi:hypothetical protein